MALQTVEIAKIKPNPYQPASRLKIPDETREKFGKSIRDHGLLQMPVVRCSVGVYEMADGWLRLEGCRWLVEHEYPEFKSITVDVRELTGREMADMVLEANTVRQDLNPIEKAKLYKRFLEDFRLTQVNLAKEHNISQGELSNTLRLLELPLEIQDKIISHEISETHALRLTPLKDWPGLLQELVKKIIATGMTTAAVEEEVRQILGREKKSRKPEPQTTPPPQVQTEPETTTVVEAIPEANAQITVTKTPEADKEPEKKEPPVTKAPEVKPLSNAPVNPFKWARKLVIEETSNGVRISLMADQKFAIKTLPGSLEELLALLPAVVDEQMNQWLAKEGK